MSFPALYREFPGMSPCRRIDAARDEFMETRIRPIDNPPHLPVFCRIPMDIIHVLIEILLVDNEVRPESPLPDTASTSLSAAFRNAFSLLQGSGRSPFNQIPARRKIPIPRREGPYAMQMIRHDDNRVDVKRPSFLNVKKRCAQEVDFSYKQIVAATKGGPAYSRYENAITFNPACIAARNYIE